MLNSCKSSESIPKVHVSIKKVCLDISIYKRILTLREREKVRQKTDRLNALRLFLYIYLSGTPRLVTTEKSG